MNTKDKPTQDTTNQPNETAGAILGEAINQPGQDTTNQRKDSVDVELEVPIKRGNTVISIVTLRRPNAGALRGLSLVNVGNMEVSTMQKLLPRICTLTETDIAVSLDVADLTALCVEVAGFLVTKADQQAYQ